MASDDCPEMFSLQLPDCVGQSFFPTCEEEGEVCENPNPDKCSLCGQVAEYLKEYVVRPPTDKCSFMRVLLDPITQLDCYQEKAKCKIELLALLIGGAGVLMSLMSLWQFPWLDDVRGCYDNDNFECTTPWWLLSLFLFLKDFVLNVMGLFTNAALVYGVQEKQVECVYVWLIWRTAAIAIGAASFPFVFTMNLFVSQHMGDTIMAEGFGVFVNLFNLIIVYAVYEKFMGCLGGGGDEVAEDDEAAEDGFLKPQGSN